MELELLLVLDLELELLLVLAMVVDSFYEMLAWFSFTFWTKLSFFSLELAEELELPMVVPVYVLDLELLLVLDLELELLLVLAMVVDSFYEMLTWLSFTFWTKLSFFSLELAEELELPMVLKDTWIIYDYFSS